MGDFGRIASMSADAEYAGSADDETFLVKGTHLPLAEVRSALDDPLRSEAWRRISRECNPERRFVSRYRSARLHH